MLTVKNCLALALLFVVSNGAQVDIPTCNRDLVRKCHEEFGITQDFIFELNAQTTRCYDAFEQDERYRCSHECILKGLASEQGGDLAEVFRTLYCEVDPQRIYALYKHCIEMVRTETPDMVDLPCGENYAIHRCIRMHLSLYPPGSHPPSFCSVRPPTKEECTKQALVTNPNFCNAVAPGWFDNFTNLTDICYEVCLLRGMGYIVGNQINAERWYQIAYSAFLERRTFDWALRTCQKQVSVVMETQQVQPDKEGCMYLYQMFKCVQFYLDPSNVITLN